MPPMILGLSTPSRRALSIHFSPSSAEGHVCTRHLTYKQYRHSADCFVPCSIASDGLWRTRLTRFPQRERWACTFPFRCPQSRDRSADPKVEPPFPVTRQPPLTLFFAADKFPCTGVIRSNEVSRELGSGCIVKVEAAPVHASCAWLRHSIANSRRRRRKAACMREWRLTAVRLRIRIRNSTALSTITGKMRLHSSLRLLITHQLRPCLTVHSGRLTIPRPGALSAYSLQRLTSHSRTMTSPISVPTSSRGKPTAGPQY